MPGNYGGKPILTTAGNSGSPLAVLAVTLTKLSVGLALKQSNIGFSNDQAIITVRGDYLINGTGFVDGASGDSLIKVYVNGIIYWEVTRQQASGVHSHCFSIMIANLGPGDALGMYGYNITQRNWISAMQVAML